MKSIFRGPMGAFAWGAIAVLYLRFSMIVNTVGTNDVHVFKVLGNHFRYGWLDIYRAQPWATYPPSGYWLSMICLWIEKFLSNNLQFSALFRIAVVGADIAALFFVWKIMQIYQTPARKLILWLCLLSPIQFLVAAFHCQLDPIVMACVFASIYLVEKDRPIAAGFVFGIGLSFKIFPLLLLPAYAYHFFRKRNPKAFIFFVALSALAPLVVMTPYLLTDAVVVLRQIYENNGLMERWGISAFLKIFAPSGWLAFYSKYGRYLVFGLSVVALWTLRRKRLNLFEACFVCFGIFFAFTPGFFLHYLSWFSVLALVVFPVFGVLYSVIGGFLIARVYGYWCLWRAPWYANSWERGHWRGFDVGLDRFLWGMMLVMFVIWLVRRLRTR